MTFGLTTAVSYTHLMEGDIIYLKSKKKKASKPYTVYVVKDGDSIDVYKRQDKIQCNRTKI